MRDEVQHCVDNYSIMTGRLSNFPYKTRNLQDLFWKEIQIVICYARWFTGLVYPALEVRPVKLIPVFTSSNILDDWLTVYRSITLVNFQLDAQNSYLFIYNTFVKILYMFRALPCSSSGRLILSMQPLVLSLFAGDCPVHRLRKFFLNRCKGSHLRRVTIPEAAYIQLLRRPPEDEQGNDRNL